MSVLVNRPLPVLPDWHWVFRPSYDANNNTSTGYIRIGQTVYRVREVMFTHQDGSGDRLWQLTKTDQTQYQIVPNPETGLECDCPDAVYRERTCKHVTVIRAAYGLIDVLNALGGCHVS
ncbi:MAG: hypothetical protein ACJ8C4_09595 [Gemmataceae bacterium]